MDRSTMNIILDRLVEDRILNKETIFFDGSNYYSDESIRLILPMCLMMHHKYYGIYFIHHNIIVPHWIESYTESKAIVWLYTSDRPLDISMYYIRTDCVDNLSTQFIVTNIMK
jgi:hypothetical protein